MTNVKFSYNMIQEIREEPRVVQATLNHGAGVSGLVIIYS
jgi:hypothetical protein